jgi:hypothetical protein
MGTDRFPHITVHTALTTVPHAVQAGTGKSFLYTHGIADTTLVRLVPDAGDRHSL